jgi:valyl-tRNA synthetase
MDDAYTRAVMRFFVHLWQKGWIYRANRIVNWCPFHLTSLSDLELAHVEVDDALTYVRYPLVGRGGHITIATARPATIVADVAVAVHPDDERYRELVGSEVVVPFVARHVPVIADERVEIEFGTGALKITPGHDPKDYEIGRDHGLPEITALAPDGRMNDAAGALAGLTQEEADERILDWLRERGQLEKREAYRHTVALCDRCKSRIEPRISLQWWCSMKELKEPALDALRSGRVRYHPESQHRFAITSLEEAPDWNISRQIWWGHQLPVWECPDGHLTVVASEPEACVECGSQELTRSEDVLDTWFSSALWPFATLGWPDETPDLRTFYPGDLNTTARDIIRLWENRMIFTGLELMGEIPFTDVVIHSLVHAPAGGRMSKSLGTGMNPIAIIEEYGADATRYGLMRMASSQDVTFAEGAIAEGRKLANKLWNASRLILQAGVTDVEPRPASIEERWILARLTETQRAIEAQLAAFDFAHLVQELYRVTFDDFCDWYLEAVKPRIHACDADAIATAAAALERLLELLHPAMPHVTEEIWTNLPGRQTRLIVAPWPETDPAYDEAATALERVQDAARIFRRSGVLVGLDAEEKRIFDAVVKPDRVAANGNAAAEIDRLRKEVERAEKMLANDRFVENAAPEVVEAEREKLAKYRRELDALSG